MTTTAPASAPVADAPVVVESLDQFVSDWNEVNATAVETQGAVGIVIDPASFTTVARPDGSEGFASGISDSVFMGGLRAAPGGGVTHLVLGGDPDGDTTAGAVLTTLLLLTSDGTDDMPALSTAYAEVATDPVPGTTRYVRTALNDFVITAVAGANSDDALVFIVAAPATDEATAQAAASTAQQAVADALLAAG